MALLPLPGSETPAPPPGSTDATTTTPQPGSETSEGAQPGSEATEGALPGSSTVPLPGSTATPSLPPGSEASEGTVPGSSASQSSLLPGSEDRAGMAKLASNYAIFLSRIKGDNAEAHTLHQRYETHTHPIASHNHITDHWIRRRGRDQCPLCEGGIEEVVS